MKEDVYLVMCTGIASKGNCCLLCKLETCIHICLAPNIFWIKNNLTRVNFLMQLQFVFGILLLDIYMLWRN